jgi:tRNA pseudouridine55 synthase
MKQEKIYNQEALVLLIDKPLKWTSFDVVNKVRYTGKFKKVGHAGTLDPLATGLLILCTGKMTKEIDTFQAQEKEYTGKFVFGKTTPSIDLETEFDADFPVEHISKELLNTVKDSLTGEISQTPPIHSAIKVNGKRAYEAARAGKELELKSRIVTVSEFEIDSNNFPEIGFRIVCSKGTYIRSLVRDFGTLAGSGAYLSELRRTRIGNFKIEDAIEVESFVKEYKQSESIL